MKATTKKILRWSTAAVAAATTTGLAVLVATSWTGLASISFGGSSSVLSLVNEIARIYQPADIIAVAGGSGAGVNAILAGIKEVGMASKDPGIVGLNPDPNDPRYQRWEAKRVKTTTIAWDGIVLVYKPLHAAPPITIDEDNLARVYAALSGVKQLTLADLGLTNQMAPIVPFARNGGALTSGTADAFWKDAHLDYQTSAYWHDLSPSEQMAIATNLTTGEYPIHVQQTAESNSQTWDRIKNAPPGAMTYLSAGFALNHREEIRRQGFELASYAGGIAPTTTTIARGYNWFRPFNLMFSLDFVNRPPGQKIRDLITWIFSAPEAQAVISANGYINLAPEQIQSMSLPDRDFFDSPDVLLHRSGAQPNPYIKG